MPLSPSLGEYPSEEHCKGECFIHMVKSCPQRFRGEKILQLNLLQISGGAGDISLGLQLPLAVAVSVCLEKLPYEIH